MRAAVNNAGWNEREGKGRCGERCRRNRAETEGSAVSPVCRRCRRLASIFLPLHSFLFFPPRVGRAPHRPTSKKKCVGVSGALGGAMPRPPSGRTQGSSVLQCKSSLNCGGEKKTPVCCHAQVSRTVVVVAVGKRASVRQRQQEAGGFSAFRARLSVRSCESVEAPPPTSYLRELQPVLKRRDTI